MTGRFSASRAGVRLGMPPQAASAETLVAQRCLSCLTGFQVRWMCGPRHATAQAPYHSLSIFIINLKVGEAGEATRWKPRGLVISACLGTLEIPEAREATAESDYAATRKAC